MPEAGVYKVLAVDDSVFVIDYLKHVISRRPQFKLIVAYNAEDCLSLVELENPDIVLLDINLPQMNGLEACKRIRASHPTLPVIIITAELDPAERFNAYQAGANDFITKPFNAEQIITHIRHYLHLSSIDVR
jgi:DNA-binding response OmpR family regulator